MLGSEQIAFAVLVVTSLLAIVDPIAAVPVYLSTTAGYSPAHRRATLRLAVVTAIIALVGFGVLGTSILQFFGITTAAFRITGGLLFLGIGSDMLAARRSRAKTTASEEQEATHREEVGIIPLGIPTLAGPGAITTVITLVAQTRVTWQRAVIFGAIVFVMLTTWVVLELAPLLFRRMGQTGLNVVTRLMGLLVMVIGVQFIIDGVREVVLSLPARA
jgi:multiple antibiotic resistance protein